MAETKRQAWARIQAEAPELAGLLVEINRAFGKPAGVRWRTNESVIEFGQVDCPLRMEWDGRLRRPRYG